MKIDKLMSRKVRACAPTDSLETAAHLMWEGDCGIVPVVDLEGRPVGVVTDRDACMTALFRGARLADVPVAEVMSRRLWTVPVDGPLHDALELMRDQQLRRLPVVDPEGRLVGMLSLADIAGLWARHEAIDERELRADDVALTLAGVSRARREERRAVMVVEITPQGTSQGTSKGSSKGSSKGDEKAAAAAKPTRRSARKPRAAKSAGARPRPKKG